jgi:hypothetical protein
VATKGPLDERSLTAFRRLDLFESVDYWRLLLWHAEGLAPVRRQLRQITRLGRRSLCCAIFFIVMRLLDWLARDTGSSQAVPADQDTEPSFTPEPTVYQTPSGNTVIDKRYRTTTGGEREESPSKDPLTDGSTPEEQPKLPVRFRRFAGAIVKLSQAKRVPELTALALADLLLTRPALRAVLSRAPSPEVNIADVIDVTSDPELGDWRRAAYEWLRDVADPQSLVDLVAGEVSAGNGSARVALMLRSIPHIASLFSEAQAGDLLGRLIEIARMPIDPYEPSGRVLLGRRALVSLLRQRPELEQAILEVLAQDEPPDDDALPDLLQLLAVALRERGLGASVTLTEAASRARLSKSALASLARLADAPIQNDPPSTEPRADRLARGLGPILRRLACWLAGICTFAISALVVKQHLPGIRPSEVPVAASIATLALLTTVHVFAANLSGARLPSAIARYSSQSWQLDVAYFASIALVLLAMCSPNSDTLKATRDWLSMLALVLWISMLMMALLTVFRRVDSSRAAGGFLQAKKHQARVIGRRFGRYQALAAELTSIVESSAPVEIRINAVPNVWDQSIASTRRGIFLPSRRSFRLLMSSGPVRAGLRIRITARLASTVNRYDTLAHAVPLGNQVIDQRWLLKARKAMRVRRVSGVDDVRSAAMALTKLSADLVSANDVGTGQQVAESLTAFVNYHMLCTRRSRRTRLRRWQIRQYVMTAKDSQLQINSPSSQIAPLRIRTDETLVPVNFLVRDVLDIATRTATTSSGPALDVPEYIVRSLLKSNTHQEHGVNVVTGTIGLCDIDSPTKLAGAIRILRVAGLRALEQRQAISLNLLLDCAVGLGTDSDSKRAVQNLVGDLAAYACRYGANFAFAGCTALESLLRSPTSPETGNLDSSGLQQFWLIGAAALAVGCLSVAVRTAAICEREGWAPRIAEASQEYEILDSLALRAEQFGNFLGELPRDALATYGEFLENYRALVTESE